MALHCRQRMGRIAPVALWLLLAAAPAWTADQSSEPAPAGQEQTVSGQNAQHTMGSETEREELRRLREELRQIKRELALLNQNLERPGIREISAGIGYIFGLCGVAALVAARRNKGRGQTQGEGD